MNFPTARAPREGPPLALYIGALLAAIALCWMSATGRTTLADLAVPIHYSGDALGVLAQVKAYAAGEILPILPKEVASLNAPFGANWTDYPAEDFLYFTASLFARLFGLFAGTTLFVLSLHLAAGLAFFVAGSALGYRRSLVLAAAILYALAPFAFVRNLSHLTLTAYWHIPLLLFAVTWAAHGAALDETPRSHRALALSAAAIAGLLNPYYLAAFGWLAGIALVGAAFAGRRRNAIAAAMLIATAAGALVLQSLDSIWMNVANGANEEAVVRNFAALDLYGLRLPDLALPWVHRSADVQAWASAYHEAAPGGRGRGEAMTSYMGVVGCISLGLLLVVGSVQVAARRFARVSPWYWMTLAILGFAVVGGLNYFLGAFGFVLLRGTNRLSIVLLALALLWACEAASRRLPMFPAFLLAAAMLALGIWDQVPPPGLIPATAGVRAKVGEDARFVQDLERALPRGAMVLQLPLKAFPETGPIGQMDDYEHFRPYLHSTALRFSYGTVKGRGDAGWQAALVPLAPADLAARASSFGFVALYVNRRAYADRGSALQASLAASLGAPVADSADLVAYRLPPPAGTVKLPPLLPAIAYRGFWSAEANPSNTWAWASAQEAAMVVRAPYLAGSPGTPAYQLAFGVQSFNGGDVAITLDGQAVASVKAGAGIVPVAVMLPPGPKRWRLEMRSSLPAKLPGTGDLRTLSFRVIDVRVEERAP